MPATQVNQKAVVTPQAPASKSKNDAPQSAEDFAAALANSITPKGGKAVVTTQSPTLSIDPKAPKGLSDVSALPLDFQGKASDEEKNAKLATLSDLLATVSHESTAPVGTSVLNLKNVLAYNNDDPELINKDLVSLLPKKEQKAATNALIKGAKSVLHDRLLGLIPKDRIPKTLKGMVETAIRFSIPISDMKLEELPKSKIGSKILTAFETQSKRAGKSIPMPKSVATIPTSDKLKQSAKGENTAEKSVSPLEQLLNENPKNTPKELTKEIQLAQTATKSPQVEPTKEHRKSTEVAKKEEIKLAKEESAKEAAQVAMKELQSVQTVAKQIQAKHSPLEQLLTDEKEATEQNTVEQKNNTHQTAKAETVQKTEHVEGKIAEGRQMMRYLSSEIKEAINDYKPPFVKLSVKLNPANLGDIDVSIVKRGDKVHVNLSSNAAALTVLQNQSNDLKVALNNAGLNDASMNFSHSNQGSKEQQQQQNNQHTTAQKYQEMASLDEDMVDSLELIIPQYG